MQDLMAELASEIRFAWICGSRRNKKKFAGSICDWCGVLVHLISDNKRLQLISSGCKRLSTESGFLLTTPLSSSITTNV